MKLYNADCMDILPTLEAQSVDLVLCDPPYGTTACAWDTIIPFEPMWVALKRVMKPYAVAALFGQEPFSSLLRASNLGMFKYDWYWRKSRPSGFTNAKLKPLKDIEIVSIFSEGSTANGAKSNMPYFPQGLEVVNKEWSRPANYTGVDRGVSPGRKNNKTKRVIENTGYPRQVLDFSNPNKDVLHPTQKPVELLEYLLKTYSVEGSLVLDFTMGSGSTGVACVNTKRDFIGVEKDEGYFRTACGRIAEALL